MKRTTTIAFAISAFLITGTALAQQGPGMGHKMQGGPMMQKGEMQGPRGGGMMGNLNLTDEQRAKVEDLMTQQQRESIPVQAQLQKLTDAFTLRIEQTGKDKEKEVMEV